jgi:hypothetical protein
MEGNEVLPMVVCEGMDINWGEDMNICADCAGVIADLIGRVDPEKYHKLRERHDKLTQQHEDLQEEFVKQGALIERIRDGAKARREVVH